MLLNNHSKVYNNYILEAREMPMLSMLESVFDKILRGIVGKQEECENWEGTIFPKIKKKLYKLTKFSKKCDVLNAGGGIFHVASLEFEGGYNVDIKSRTCDSKRWQLTGIPCHHAIACCRANRTIPEKMVHSCFSIDKYKRAYA
jgi:hypothetical protein